MEINSSGGLPLIMKMKNISVPLKSDNSASLSAAHFEAEILGDHLVFGLFIRIN